MDRSPEPGERRRPGTDRPALERAPGDRYRPPAPADGDRRSTARAVVFGALVGLGGVLVIVLLGGVLSLSAGLLVVVGFIGWAIGRTVAGNAPAQAGPRLPRIAAAALAVDAVVLGQLGLWLHAISQGGALELVPYLAEARGLLVPLEIGMAGAVAWWTAR